MTFRLELEQDPPVCVEAEAGETILASLLRAEVDFPHDCQAGNCGTCKCELVLGDITELPYSEFALDEEERASGLILACRSQVWGDCIVRPLEQDDLVVHPSRIMQCDVIQIADLSRDTKSLQLEIKSGGPYTFSAGQYAVLAFPSGAVIDAYMANRPVDAVLEFYVHRNAGDAASEFVHSKLRVGDRIKVSGPYGKAYLRAQHSGPIVAFALAGALAPMRSIVETALLADPRRDVRLLISQAKLENRLEEDRLERLAQKFAKFHYQFMLGSQEALLHNGDIATLLERAALDLGNTKAYLAGPRADVERVVTHLQHLGMSERDIHTDALVKDAA